MEFESAMLELTYVIIACIDSGAVLHVIITLMKCRSNDTSVKEGLGKCRRVIFAAIIASCTYVLAYTFRRYFR